MPNLESLFDWFNQLSKAVVSGLESELETIEERIKHEDDVTSFESSSMFNAQREEV